MKRNILLACLLCATVGAQYANFQNTQSMLSQGGHGQCVTGDINVDVVASNTLLNIQEPESQEQATDDITRFTSASMMQFIEEVSGPLVEVSRTYTIRGKFCKPVGASSTTNKIQILVHGIGFDKTYWDFAVNYSYVDQAAARGDWTFSYDRLATGNSSYPNPISDVQAQTEVAILAKLISDLRSGYFGINFTVVDGVGHSYGSQQLTGLLAMNPAALDAVVLTGFTMNTSFVSAAFQGQDLAIANTQTAGFSQLPNGYFVPVSPIGVQQGFLKYPNFAPAILQAAFAGRQPVSLGTFFTEASIVKPTQFTGPVLVLDGLQDYFFCGGDCLIPTDLAAAVGPALYNASRNFQSVLINGTGHGISLHTTAFNAYEIALTFLAGTSSSQPQPVTDTGNCTPACGSGLSCCNGQCYSTSQYTCFQESSGYQLCPSGQQACGNACYNPSNYQCQNGMLAPANLMGV